MNTRYYPEITPLNDQLPFLQQLLFSLDTQQLEKIYNAIQVELRERDDK